MQGVRFVRQVQNIERNRLEVWVMRDAELSWEVRIGDQIKLFGEFLTVEVVTHFHPPARTEGDREIHAMAILMPPEKVSDAGFGDVVNRMIKAGWKAYDAVDVVNMMRAHRDGYFNHVMSIGRKEAGQP